MKVNKYYPFAFIYFFINAVGLPFGVLYTILLTPVFYLWLVVKGKRGIIFKFLLVAAPFVVFHLINGVDQYYYFRSVLLFATVYIFCYAFYTLITTYDSIELIYKNLVVTNFALACVALVCVFTSWRGFFWNEWGISVGGTEITGWPRLQMFTYEPSYYSSLLVPLFGFYFIKFILGQTNGNAMAFFMMLIITLVLSFSMGVISGLILAALVLFVIHGSKFISSKRIVFSISALAMVAFVSLLLLLLFYRDNPFFVRIIAIVAGKDGSANGRTYEAFQLAYTIAKIKSIWWGVGPGQLKLLGNDIIIAFYKYPSDFGQVSIPNAVAEHLALFGIIGLAIRFIVIFYLFFRTKVLNNYYQTLLFFYIFIYQFTGSFTTNIVEYVIWILAFTNVFPQFNRGTARTAIAWSPAVTNPEQLPE